MMSIQWTLFDRRNALGYSCGNSRVLQEVSSWGSGLKDTLIDECTDDSRLAAGPSPSGWLHSSRSVNHFNQPG
jgi:hypothetical protein